MDFVVAIDGIDLSIVKQNRKVVYGTAEIMVRPWSFDPVRHIDLHPDSVDV